MYARSNDNFISPSGRAFRRRHLQWPWQLTVLAYILHRYKNRKYKGVTQLPILRATINKTLEPVEIR